MGEKTPAEYLQLIALGWKVIESDGSQMTIEAPDDWEYSDPKEPSGYIINTDDLLRRYPLAGG